MAALIWVGRVAVATFVAHIACRTPCVIKTYKEPLYGIVLLQIAGLSAWLVRPDLFPALAG